MKAILVIDLDDEWYDRLNTNCDEMLADVTVYKKESLEHQCDYTQRIYRCWCPLKPMPEKIEKPKDTNYDLLRRVTAEIYGWNACIDEITGGEKND